MRAAVYVAVLTLFACDVPVDGRQPVAVSSEQELRPTDTNSQLLWRYASGEVIESVAMDGGTFRVHFTLSGINAVPDAAFAEQVERVYEEVGALYHGPLGYRLPMSDATITPNGGDDRFDVYLLDFAGQADGAFRVDQCPPNMVDRCIGYVVQENDFAGYGYPSLVVATRILGSHEYFHAVQAAYDANQNIVVSEGTAVWATERYDPSTNDFEHFVGGYLSDPGRSIDNPPIGPVPSFAYGSAIFFKFLTERHDDELIRKLWERLENGKGHSSEPADQEDPTWVIQLDALLKSDYQSTFADEFREFAKWNLFVGSAADATQSYANGAAYPSVAMRTVQLPHLEESARFYYAAAQYYSVSPGTRSEVTAKLVDVPTTPLDDTEDLTVWLTVRRNGKNEQLTMNGTVSPNGGSVIVGVVNTRRGRVGTASTQRPGLCIGTPDEVATCAALIRGDMPDAGMPQIDAGVETDAGVAPSPSPMGCGCGMSGSPLMLLALALARMFSRGARNA